MNKVVYKVITSRLKNRKPDWKAFLICQSECSSSSSSNALLLYDEVSCVGL